MLVDEGIPSRCREARRGVLRRCGESQTARNEVSKLEAFAYLLWKIAWQGTVRRKTVVNVTWLLLAAVYAYLVTRVERRSCTQAGRSHMHMPHAICRRA